MITCSRCFTLSTDSEIFCSTCQADLRDCSTTAVALKKLIENPRVRYVRIAVPNDACPACKDIQGTYPKEQAPVLPVPGCSEKNGCQAFYEPLLAVVYP